MDEEKNQNLLYSMHLNCESNCKFLYLGTITEFVPCQDFFSIFPYDDSLKHILLKYILFGMMNCA